MCFTDYERLQYQRACEAYQRIQQRKDALPEKYKKLFRELERVKIRRYDVDYDTLAMIAEVYGANTLNSFGTVFRLGFLKGQRCEKARQKKFIKEKAERSCIKHEQPEKDNDYHPGSGGDDGSTA